VNTSLAGLLHRVRKVPRLGGLSLTFLGLELRRTLRNRSTIFFTLMMPPIFFLIFGTAAHYRTTTVGRGNATAYILVSMAVYGAMLATTSGGAMVAVERALGWSRQLALTPLRPLTYIALKMLVAMTLGLLAVLVVFAVGAGSGAQMDGIVWVESALMAWAGSAVFAAFGLFMGYLLPSENLMQVLGPVLALLAFAGGLFIPLSGGLFATVAAFTPAYGLASIARAPLTGDGLTVRAAANLLIWCAIFTGGAAALFRRDTRRT